MRSRRPRWSTSCSSWGWRRSRSSSRSPGSGSPGSAASRSWLLAVYGLTVAVPSWPGLGVLLLGIGLLVLDVRLRSLSLADLAGLAAFGAGSVLAWSDVDASIRDQPVADRRGRRSRASCTTGSRSPSRSSRATGSSGTQRGLVGLVGEARGRLAPDGPVFVKGALWRGRTDGAPIEAGTPIRVRGVEGLILQVAAEPAQPVEHPGA